MHDCQQRVSRANRLLGGLSGESKRWEEESAKTAAGMRTVLGDVLLGAGGVTYVGPFDR